MNIWFIKSTYVVRGHHDVWAARENNMGYDSPVTTISKKEQIKELLREKFNSVIFHDSWELLRFCFEDDADNAFFILWANGGTEI